jgi:hypothetical protein
MKNISLIIPYCIYIVLFFLLFPLNKYHLDADGIAYIQQARQYASGNYHVALNGCWSPLISWLLTPFIKLGFDPVICCKYINGALGLFCMISFNTLSYKINISQQYRQLLLLYYPVLFLSFAFNLLGPDVLQLFILSVYLNIICSKKIVNSKIHLVFAGIAGAMAYYAKAYNFFFFILHISIVLFIVLKNIDPINYKRLLISKLSIVLTAFLLCTVPYIILLSNKYQKFTISSASAITINKSLEPGFTDGKKLIVPPRDHNAISIADDPTFFQKNYITPFTSTHYFLKQIKITVANIIEYFKLLNDISFLAITISLFFLILVVAGLLKVNETINQLLLTTLLLYPCGYLLIAIEWRYIWLIPLLLLFMAGIILNHYAVKNGFSKRITCFFSLLILLSFSVVPVLKLKKMNSAENVYYLAVALKANGINGNFIAPYDGWRNSSRNYILGYLNNIKMYGLYSKEYTATEIFENAGKYNIKYFYDYYKTVAEKEHLLRSDMALKAVKVYDDIYPGIIVFQLF